MPASRSALTLDMIPLLTKVYETVARIICHSSMFKRNDFELGRLALNRRIYCRCDMFKIEEAHHILMQCPSFQLPIEMLLYYIICRFLNALSSLDFDRIYCDVVHVL